MRAFIGTDLIRALPAEDVEIRDTKLAGFLVRCRPSGVHSYRLVLGRGRALTLGRVGVLDVHEAREAARRRIAQAALGADPVAERRAEQAVPTWRAFLEETYAPWAAVHLKSADETLRKLRVSFKEFAALPLTELTLFRVERWRTARLGRGVSRATTNRDLDAAKAAIARAVAWEILPKHPFGALNRQRTDQRPVVRYLTDDETHRLEAAFVTRNADRRAARDRMNAWLVARGRRPFPPLGRYVDHLEPLVRLALHTGCRRGELFQLHWRDVDFVGARLYVHGKGTKSGQTRVLPLNAEALGALQSWATIPIRPADFVFSGHGLDRMRQRGARALTSVKTSFPRLLALAGIADFRFHDCRHTFASRLVMAGVDLNTVRELLGHADLKMVLRYAHLAPEYLAGAVAKLVAAT